MAILEEWLHLASRAQVLSELQQDRMVVLAGLVRRWAEYGGALAFPEVDI